MLSNLPNKDLRTFGYVLKRTNYGEADRILNIITPKGKLAAIAKSVRKSKSKLAGGIEIFSLIDINVHFGRGDMATVTSAKMVKYYGSIMRDLNKMELAAFILKKVSLAADSSDSPEYFDLVDQSLAGLETSFSSQLVESWFLMNLARVMGDEINLYRDVDGFKLSPDKKYFYDINERALIENDNGDLGAEEIKVLRLLYTAKLSVVSRIKDIDKMLDKILRLARTMSGAV